MLNVLEVLKERLRAFPQVKYTESENSVAVDAADKDGFDIEMRCDGSSSIVVSLGGWHDDFSQEQASDALDCFVAGLRDDIEIEVFSKGGTDYKWLLHSNADNTWCKFHTVGLVFFPFWRRKTVRFLKNRWIATEQSPESEPCG